MEDIKAHYKTLCRYLNFDNKGEILGTGCGTVAMTKHTKFPKETYEFGKHYSYKVDIIPKRGYNVLEGEVYFLCI